MFKFLKAFAKEDKIAEVVVKMEIDHSGHLAISFNEKFSLYVTDNGLVGASNFGMIGELYIKDNDHIAFRRS